MRKKILRFLSAALAALLIASVLLPLPVTAIESDNESEQIKQQIKQVYRSAQKHTGRYSFDGLCGTLTGLQLYFMGITDRIVLQNGNQGYDVYCKQEITSGGYRVRAYPSSKGSLREILNDITKNGTVDAYNLLVGWHTTPSSLGQLYGHSAVIHAIIDGKVYFMESNVTRISGVSFAEGAPIICSIDEFCTYYERNRYRFEGVILFGTKTYGEMCKAYTGNFYAAALSDAQLWTQPCRPETDESTQLIRDLTPGEQLTISAVYQNTAGEYWYRVEGEQIGYVPAESAQIRQSLCNDLQLTNLEAPTMLKEGSSFYIHGDIYSEKNQIFTVRAQIYSLGDEGMTQIIGSTQVVEDRDFRLSGSDISKELTFRKLAPGAYRYVLAAVVSNHYVENGQLLVQWDTVELWASDFRVTSENTELVLARFDACGGTTSLGQRALTGSEPLGTLPTAQKTGYVFKGWYTAPVGGERIDETLTISQDTTIYAQWTDVNVLHENWNNASERWYFYSDGTYTTGCLELDGVLYYFSSADALGQSWTIWASTETIPQ